MTQQERTARILTLVLSAVWVASLLGRVAHPEWAFGPALDSLMVTVVGWNFSKEGLGKGRV